MGWWVAAVVVVALAALVWRTSGRARDLRRRRIDAEIGKSEGRAGMYGGGFRHGGGPTPNGGPGF